MKRLTAAVLMVGCLAWFGCSEPASKPASKPEPPPSADDLANKPSLSPAEIAVLDRDPGFYSDPGLCGQTEGKTPRDLKNLNAFCSKGLEPGVVVGAIAMDSILWLKVSRGFADAMRRDRLSAQQLVRFWMNVWRSLVGRPSVTVYIEWMDATIATGESTVLNGDRVTFAP